MTLLFPEKRYRCDDIPLVSGAGVYVFYLEQPTALPSITLPASRVLYIGMTDDCLEARNHFYHEHSGFSTFRRSLGALLKDELGLKALPRAAGPSPTNTNCYRFNEAGELALTRWMREHLTYACYPNEDPRAMESELIRHYEPPLNLTKWKNPNAAYLKALRKKCKQEALRHRTG